MDASKSVNLADSNNVFSFLMKKDGHNFFAPMQQKNNAVIKYTKIPDFEIEPKLPRNVSHYTGKPQTRRIATIGDVYLRVVSSVRSNLTPAPSTMATNYTKRKMITLSECEEQSLHPKFSKEKMAPPKRATGTDLKSEKQSYRTTSRLTNSPKYTKESKTNSAYNKKGVPSQNYRLKYTSSLSSDSSKNYVREKDLVQINSNTTKSITRKNFITPSESVRKVTGLKSIMYDNIKASKSILKPKPPSRHTISPSKTKINVNKMFSRNKTLTITVPIDEELIRYQQPTVTEIKSAALITPACMSTTCTCDRGSFATTTIQLQDVKMVDQITQMDDIEMKCDNSVQTESFAEVFDSLEIPNVTLTKGDSKTGIASQESELPNLTVPAITIATSKEDITSKDLSYCQSASYVFSHATVTYTTRQKINFQIVSEDERVNSNILPPPADCPLNVVSLLKKHINNGDKYEKITSDDKPKKSNYTGNEYCMDEMSALNCSFVYNKLTKPSEIISTIKLNKDLLQNDFICEQFQRELNFIDSFFESLQYLESCSLSDKGFSDTNVENLVNNTVLFDSSFDIKNSEYDNFLSNLENGANIDDTETMASKSLFLLNLLIRDEQRRAKNLLFVLKMREDALKDFTKSQILWLEKKKKQENTDISTLKKKQRGALLKLQHECGEMQRMRKALLTLSEKRKVALMKTKKNIELKLKDNVDVEQIILGKKKLKRSLSGDRITSPLKCFELSSSGCEESTTPKVNWDQIVNADNPALVSITSAEKCVQAGDTILSDPLPQPLVTEITAENFVAVDGAYLNILFHDLALPQIFNSGKQYEVNEEMLKNIINSTNNYNNSLTGSEVGKLMDNIKVRKDESSSPSTARSLVYEFDQYYRSFGEGEKSSMSDEHDHDHDHESSDTSVVNIQSDTMWEKSEEELVQRVSSLNFNDDQSSETLTDIRKTCVCQSATSTCNMLLPDTDAEPVTSQVQTGPLPVPVGEAAVVETMSSILPSWALSNFNDCSTTEAESMTASSLETLSPLDQSEAEELRRQQLAIEREIKALEQQQSQLLVVREIPDKPPPPYTPPNETKPKLPPKFTLDDSTETVIKEYILDEEQPITDDDSSVFDVFLKDFCHESLEQHKLEQSDKPWDACNLLPQKTAVDSDGLVQNTIEEVKEVLTTPGPAVMSVSNRRSDHIDDILFAEWKRCEPEWTNLHNDEVIVKNQIFENIFQKILLETVVEYKKTVNSPIESDD